MIEETKIILTIAEMTDGRLTADHTTTEITTVATAGIDQTTTETAGVSVEETRETVAEIGTHGIEDTLMITSPQGITIGTGTTPETETGDIVMTLGREEDPRVTDTMMTGTGDQ